MSGQILQYVINYQLVKSEPAVCVLRISTARFSTKRPCALWPSIQAVRQASQ